MSDPPPSDCQICGASPVVKVLYPAAIHFKGSGFYSTDYGRGNRRSASKDGDGAGGGDEPKKPEKKESKASDAKASDAS